MDNSRRSRSNRQLSPVKINTGENVTASYRYKGNIIVPGSRSVLRGLNRTSDPYATSRPRHRQHWMDSHGQPHPTRRAAVAASDPESLRKGWQPSIERT